MISATGKKSCTVLIQSPYTTPPPVHKVTVAISLLKNTRADLNGSWRKRLKQAFMD